MSISPSCSPNGITYRAQQLLHITVSFITSVVLGGDCINAVTSFVLHLPAGLSCRPHPCPTWIFPCSFLAFLINILSFHFIDWFLVSSLPSSCDVYLFRFQFATESEWACSQTHFLSICTVTRQLSRTLSEKLTIFSHIFSKLFLPASFSPTFSQLWKN